MKTWHLQLGTFVVLSMLGGGRCRFLLCVFLFLLVYLLPCKDAALKDLINRFDKIKNRKKHQQEEREGKRDRAEPVNQEGGEGKSKDTYTKYSASLSDAQATRDYSQENNELDANAGNLEHNQPEREDVRVINSKHATREDRYQQHQTKQRQASIKAGRAKVIEEASREQPQAVDEDAHIDEDDAHIEEDAMTATTTDKGEETSS